MTDGASGGGRTRSTELRLRVISALLLAPAVLLATYVGGWPFAIGAALCAAILLQEWVVIVRAQNLIATVGAALAVAGAMLAVATGHAQIALGLLLLSAAVLLGAGWLLGAVGVAWLAGGVLYAGLTGVVLVILRAGEAGFIVIVFLFAVVWATDIAAYFAGRRIGGPKLWARVSPKKTWSGAIGGFLAAVLVGLVAGLLVGRAPLSVWLVAAGVLSVFSQVGDLLESALKRRFGVKDSGRIIPGHGGVMDRVDGLTGAGVLGYLVAVAASGALSDPVAALVGMQGY
ncbi:phosphatidate cytidylyltransferase [Stappia sp.]|uniref:phosphatidate cytidylyltransferase n=1 Tax=Stappia sp. TaxID=1870903 RepID=UPI003D0A08F6